MLKTLARLALIPAVALVLAAGLAAQTVATAASEPAAQTADKKDTGIPEKSYKSISPLPIAMYDGDIGFGYGAKVKMVDYLGWKESFDLILFNSTKGERWYVFTFSWPDIEIRQGHSYPISLDIKAEYDKFLKYAFYGLGADTVDGDLTYFTHTTKTLQFTFGHGFSPRLALEASYAIRGLTYAASADEGDVLAPLLQPLVDAGSQFVPYASLALRYDTSNSQIHPTRGFRAILQDDLSKSFLGSTDSDFNRFTLDLRKYMTVFGDVDVFAVRALVQYVDGDQIPFFDLSILGGGGTMNAMRGYSQNRFLDKGKFLTNIEYRFPILWHTKLILGMKLGGVVFIDAGTVWPSLSEIDLGKMAVDYGAGLRIYMPDFVVRVDVGFQPNGKMGLYFNFGHIF
jgi:outer membrane protein assembly factor BamA